MPNAGCYVYGSILLCQLNQFLEKVPHDQMLDRSCKKIPISV